MNQSYSIRTENRQNCPCCSATGRMLYCGLKDVLYGVPGTWNIRKCKECSMLWLDPMPHPDDLAKLYTNYHTHDTQNETGFCRIQKLFRIAAGWYLANRYGNGAPLAGISRLIGNLLFLHPVLRTTAESLVMHVPVDAGRNLLEVGCGSGNSLKRLKDLGWQVEGIDFDPFAVASARANGLEVKLGDLFSQKYEDGRFDVVALSHLIEHVPNPLILLNECLRVLKKGGWLVLLTPNASSLGRHYYGRDWRGLEPPRHLQIFSPNALKRMVVEAGFQNVHCRSLLNSSGIRLASKMLKRNKKVGVSLPASIRFRLGSLFISHGEWFFQLAGIETGDVLLLTGRK